jgi:hypothetical protein
MMAIKKTDLLLLWRNATHTLFAKGRMSYDINAGNVHGFMSGTKMMVP